MAKDKMFEARMLGMNYALRIVKESGVEALEEELKMRGRWDIPIGITRSDLSAAATQIKKDIATDLQCRILLIVQQVLHDKYGFGKRRIERFQDEVEKLCQCVIEKRVSYDDLAAMQSEEVFRGNN